MYVYVYVLSQIFYCEFLKTIHSKELFLSHLDPNLAQIQLFNQNLFAFSLTKIPKL
jgi:hypothetical protein